MNHLADLFLLADRYREARGIAETTLSTRVFADGKRLGAIRAGSDIGVRRLDLAINWFSANWPDGLAWPDAVDRPVVKLSEAAE